MRSSSSKPSRTCARSAATSGRSISAATPTAPRRVLASWVEDEYRALQEDGYQRQVALDDRGTFLGTLAP